MEEADRCGSFGIDSPAGTEAMRTTKQREEPSRCQGGPVDFRAKNDLAGAQAPPARRVWPGPAASNFGASRRKMTFGDVTGPIFRCPRTKNRLGALLARDWRCSNPICKGKKTLV